MKDRTATKYYIDELRWSNFDARWENGAIIVRIPAPSYKIYITKRKVLGAKIKMLECDRTWDTEWVKGIGYA